jgi:NAD-dependent dihydropyrimidine dehydrogenase PreA subunit
MAYVITDNFIKDSPCVEVCPTDCIHPKQDEPGFEAATQMYVDPKGCIDCGACISACTSDSIHALEDAPEDKKGIRREERVFLQALILRDCLFLSTIAGCWMSALSNTH